MRMYKSEQKCSLIAEFAGVLAETAALQLFRVLVKFYFLKFPDVGTKRQKLANCAALAYNGWAIYPDQN